MVCSPTPNPEKQHSMGLTSFLLRRVEATGMNPRGGLVMCIHEITLPDRAKPV